MSHLLCSGSLGPRFASPYLTLPPSLLSFSSAFAICVRYCSFSAANRSLPPDGHARASLVAPPSSYHLLLPLSSSSFSSSSSSSSSRKQHAVKFIPLVESLILLYLSFCQGIRYVHLFYSCSFLFRFSPSLSLFFLLCPLLFMKRCNLWTRFICSTFSLFFSFHFSREASCNFLCNPSPLAFATSSYISPLAPFLCLRANVVERYLLASFSLLSLLLSFLITLSFASSSHVSLPR